jgi:hypothetical protein
VPRSTARTGAVTLIQRFGSALNLNVHFHVLFLDGVCVEHRAAQNIGWADGCARWGSGGKEARSTG